MSTNPVEPPSGQHPSEGSRNPKAEAKAAKAYAKAMRPWYKKKRVIIPAGLVALTIAGAAMSSSDSGSSSASGGSASSAPSTASGGGGKSAGAKHGGGKSAGASHSSGGSGTHSSGGNSASGGTDGKSAKVGQAVTNAGTTYKVTSVKTTRTIGDPDFLGERADGVFVIVNLRLTNNKDETKTFLDSTAKLKTSDGKEYGTSSKAVLAFGDDSLMLKQIQPDLTTHGKLAFEIPPRKVSNSTLVIEDLWGSGEIKVDLGL
jgi:hypothetical protein